MEAAARPMLPPVPVMMQTFPESRFDREMFPDATYGVGCSLDSKLIPRICGATGAKHDDKWQKKTVIKITV
jgi:hypothetical protein